MATIKDVYELDTKSSLAGIKSAITAVKEQGAGVVDFGKKALSAAKGGVAALVKGVGSLSGAPLSAVKALGSGLGKLKGAVGGIKDVLGKVVGGFAVFGLAMEGLQKAKEIVTSLIAGIREASPGAAEQLDRMGAAFGEIKKTVLGAIGNALIPLLSKLADAMESPAFKEFVSTVGSWLGWAVTQAADYVQNKLIPALVQLARDWLPKVQHFIFGVYTWLVNLRQSVGQTAGEWKERWSQIQAVVQSAREAIVPILKEVWAHIAVVWEEIRPKLAEAWQGIQNDLLPTLKVIVEFIRRHKDDIIQIINGLVDIVGGLVETLIDFISGAIRFGMALIRGDWKGAWDIIKQTVQNVGRDIGNVVNGFLGVVLGFLGVKKDEFVGTWSGIWNNFLTILNTVWGNIKHSLAGGINSVIDLLNGFILQYNDAVSALGIPSLGYIAHVSLAKGGIVSSPIAAVVGDNPRSPEVVSPLEDLVPLLRQALGGMGGGGITVVVNGPFGPGYTPEDAGRRAGNGFVRELRAQGVNFS